jgi:hypothetical protein
MLLPASSVREVYPDLTNEFKIEHNIEVRKVGGINGQRI